MASHEYDARPDGDSPSISGTEALAARRRAETQALLAETRAFMAKPAALVARWDATEAARAPQRPAGEATP
jgi:hypothetical protein